MLKLVKTIGLALSLLSASAIAIADIVNIDWKAENDKEVFLDTTNGTEWLDFSITDGMSVAQVELQLGEGGNYEGFRVANYQEVYSLFDSLAIESGIPRLSDTQYYSSTSNSAGFSENINFMYHTIGTNYVGGSGFTGNQYYSNGFFYGSGESVTGLKFSGIWNKSGGTIMYHQNLEILPEEGTQTKDSASGYYGVMLVSDGGATLTSQLYPELMINNASSPINDVFSPFTGAAIGLSLLILAFRRKT